MFLLHSYNLKSYKRMQQGTASLRSQSLSQCEIAHQSLNSAEVHRTAS